MVLEIVTLSWFAVLFLIGVGKWAGDGDTDLMAGVVIVLGLPTIVALTNLIFGG